jgi:hypothetical protein
MSGNVFVPFAPKYLLVGSPDFHHHHHDNTILPSRQIIQMVCARRTSTTAEVVLLLPRHCSVFPQTKSEVIYVWCADPRVAWNGLQPLLFLSPRRIASRATLLLLQPPFSSQTNKTHCFSEKTSVYQSQNGVLQEINAEKPVAVCEKRVFRIRRSKLKRNRFRRPVKRVIVWIQPPLVTKLKADWLFSSIVLRWEHLYLQLQSLSAFLATLGGGYFLCRQLATAAVLARRQRQLALLLGDYETADKCTINEAYNYVHAGFFAHALRLIRSVRKSVLARNQEVGGPKLILSMCASAKLFCRRVKAYRQQLHLNASLTTVSLTQDDYQRIRILPNDQPLIKAN